jgi:alkylation response protein AidB-like acyl-CoA dehydrogenase
MSDDPLSFVRGIFAGAIHDSLLFPFPASLEERNPEETRTVRRLLSDLERLRDGLIDPARFDEEETIPEEVIQALAKSGWLGLSIPREYGGLGLSPAAYSHVFGALSSADASLGVLVAVHCGLGDRALRHRRPEGALSPDAGAR